MWRNRWVCHRKVQYCFYASIACNTINELFLQLTDLTIMDDKFTAYRQLSSQFLCIYQPIHKTDLFIVNVADL